jgi:prepilin-type N-terminal cleavage/methylation domain-containing protein
MRKGLTLIEIVVTIAVMGIVITPLASMFIVSAKINRESDIKYKATMTAQRHMEEIKAMHEISLDDYVFNSSTKSYERVVSKTDNELEALIRIRAERSYLYVIDVLVYENGNEIFSLSGSKITR